MGLINNSLESLYNGVSEQSAEHRLQTQVKEMINAYPTINTGLLKRNPTVKLLLSDAISYNQEIWTHEYDRGLSGINEEKFTINMSTDGLEVVNVLSGKVYKEGSDLTFEGTAKDYLHPFSGSNGYASVTIKDTTFIVNRAVTPELKTSGLQSGEPQTITRTVYEAQIQMLSEKITVTFPDGGTATATRNAPYEAYFVADNYADGFTTITVDGTVIKIDSIHDRVYQNRRPIFGPYALYLANGGLTYSSYVSDVLSNLQTSLSSSIYDVWVDSSRKLRIKRKDGATVAVSYAINYKYIDGTPAIGDDTEFVGAITYSNFTDTVSIPTGEYLKTAYLWLKTANAVNPYTYDVSITDINSNNVSASTSSASTVSAASALAATINANANFSASAIGSVVKIVGNVDVDNIQSSDTWGNQASISWHYQLSYTTDLPQNMGFQDSYVEIISPWPRHVR